MIKILQATTLDFDDTKIPASSGSAPSSKKSGNQKIFFMDEDCKKAAALFEVLNDMLRAKPEDPAKDPMIQELKIQCEVPH